MNDCVENNVCNTYLNTSVNTEIVFEYLSKFLMHIYQVEIYRYYIALEAPQLLDEILPLKKIKLFGVNIDDYNLLKNYTKLFKAFLGKICDHDIDFSYCNMLMNALSDYIVDNYKLNQNVDYCKVVCKMKEQIRDAIVKVLIRISSKDCNLSKLFLWQSNRKILDKGKIAYFSFKHPLYCLFNSIHSSEFSFDVKNINSIADKLVSGNAVVFCGYILIPEDFGLDVGIDELDSDDILLVKFVNRCFQELIDNGYYDFFWLDKNMKDNYVDNYTNTDIDAYSLNNNNENIYNDDEEDIN